MQQNLKKLIAINEKRAKQDLAEECRRRWTQTTALRVAQLNKELGIRLTLKQCVEVYHEVYGY